MSAIICKENNHEYTLTKEGLEFIRLAEKLLHNCSHRRYLSNVEEYTGAIKDLRTKYCKDPAGKFLQIYAMLSHNHKTSISCEEILRKGATFGIIKSMARLRLDIDNIVKLFPILNSGESQHPFFSWILPQA